MGGVSGNPWECFKSHKDTTHSGWFPILTCKQAALVRLDMSSHLFQNMFNLLKPPPLGFPKCTSIPPPLGDFFCGHQTPCTIQDLQLSWSDFRPRALYLGVSSFGVLLDHSSTVSAEPADLRGRWDGPRIPPRIGVRTWGRGDQ